MRVCFSAAVKSQETGSWQCRGLQMAAAFKALGVDAATAFRAEQVRKPIDILIVVKRAHSPHLNAARAMGAVVIYDPLDWWPQPNGNEWCRDDASQRLRDLVVEINPDGVVVPTHAMQRDLAWSGGPTLVLPHHARSGQSRNPIRRDVRRIGYEGSVRYLGRWQGIIEDHCARRGWEFVTNPQSLADLDVVVALRDPPWGGYASDNWKSGVKLANAWASGTPFIAQPEAGYVEMESGGEVWVRDYHDLSTALDALVSYGERQRRAALMYARAREVAIEPLARGYIGWLKAIYRTNAAEAVR